VEYYQSIELKMFEVVKPVAVVRPLIREVPPYIITQDEIDTEKRKGVKIVIKFSEDKFNVHRFLNLVKRPKRHANFQRPVTWHHKHFAAKDDGASTSSSVKRMEEKEEKEEEEEAGCAVSSLSRKRKRVRVNLFNCLEDSDEDSEEESIVRRPLVLSSDED
jgi:hypothetical protein